MNVSGSTKISVLDFSVLYDISGGTPHITLTNRSSGPNLSTCTWWVVITTPSNSVIHSGSFSVPDMNGAWSTWTMPEDWPQRFYHIEWSGEPYTVTLYVSDGDTTPKLFSLALNCEICPPGGNSGSAKNNFGVGQISTPVTKCDLAQVIAQDNTNYLYKGSVGTVVSLTWKIIYPTLPDGSSLPPATITATSYVSIPVTYNGEGYNLYLLVIRDYAIDANNTIRIQFKSHVTFDVSCNIDLCGIKCGYEKLIDDATKNCTDAALKNKLIIVNGMVSLALIAVNSKCTGVDLPELIGKIKAELGEYDCGCSEDKTGIVPSGLI